MYMGDIFAAARNPTGTAITEPIRLARIPTCRVSRKGVQRPNRMLMSGGNICRIKSQKPGMPL